MASTDSKLDRHKNSSIIGVRISDDLRKQFESKLEMDGKTKNGFLLQAIEDYVYPKKRD